MFDGSPFHGYLVNLSYTSVGETTIAHEYFIGFAEIAAGKHPASSRLDVRQKIRNVCPGTVVVQQQPADGVMP
jgi:hypothetical protein